jgi:hypothetical protein
VPVALLARVRLTELAGQNPGFPLSAGTLSTIITALLLIGGIHHG